MADENAGDFRAVSPPGALRDPQPWQSKGLGEGQGWEEEEDGAFTGCWVLGAQPQGVRCVWGAVSPWAEGLLRVSFLILVAPFPHI